MRSPVRLAPSKCAGETTRDRAAGALADPAQGRRFPNPNFNPGPSALRNSAPRLLFTPAKEVIAAPRAQWTVPLNQPERRHMLVIDVTDAQRQPLYHLDPCEGEYHDDGCLRLHWRAPTETTSPTSTNRRSTTS